MTKATVGFLVIRWILQLIIVSIIVIRDHLSGQKIITM